MKLFRSLTLIAATFFQYQIAFAYVESEPNNSTGTANVTYEDSVMTGIVGNTGDAYDYFSSVPVDDGSIQLNFTYVSTVSTSDFFVYMYNKSGALLASKVAYNVGVGTFSDNLVVHCRLQDSIYFMTSSSGVISYSIWYHTTSTGTNDIEPNNSIAESQWFNQADTVKGRIGYTSITPDYNDYYYSVLPEDGTLEFYVQYNNTSNSTSSDFYSYVYKKNGGLIGSSYKNNQPLGIGYDTIKIYCLASDTVYFRVGSSGCFSYEFNFQVIPSGTADLESNNTFGEATYFSMSDTVKGRIGYGTSVTDSYDYYLTSFTEDGTLEYYVKYNNTSNSTTSDFYSYIYKKNYSFISSSGKVNQPLGIGYDTIRVHCLAGDTIFFRISSNGCFSYEFNYTVIPTGTADLESNNTFGEATYFSMPDTVKGRIGYGTSVTDSYDYYLTSFTEDGTLEYYVKYNNTSNSTSSDFYSHIYKKNYSLISSRGKVNQPLGIGYDTIRVHCLAGDTIFFRISSNGCFSYEFNYTVIPTGTADLEPNNNFGEATYFSMPDTVKGRIGYGTSVTDSYDYYYTSFTEDGTLEYYVKYNNTSNSTISDFYSYIYKKNFNLITSSSKVDQPLGISYDTIRVHCLAGDTIYFRISSHGCFSYEFNYNIIPSGTSDMESNNTLGDANYVSNGVMVNGRIGYGTSVTDGNDYFISGLPNDGVLEYYVMYNNTSNTTTSDFYSYIYRKNGTLLTSSSKPNQPLGISFDTIQVNCLSDDTLYFRMTSNGCFSYEFGYSVTNTTLTASAITNSSMTIEWTDTQSSQWQIEGGPSGFIPGNGSFDTVLSVSPYPVTGLAQNTSYDFYVRPICGAGDTLERAGPFTFITLCDPISVLPFYESFEDTSVTLGCWRNENVNGSGEWSYMTGAGGGSITSAHGGTKNAGFVSQSGTNSPVTRLVSPTFDLTSLTNPRLTFYYAQEDSVGNQNFTRVLYRTSSTSAWIELWADSNNVDTWTRVVLDLPSGSSTYQIAFEGINNWGRRNVIDDIKIDEKPTIVRLIDSQGNPYQGGEVAVRQSGVYVVYGLTDENGEVEALLPFIGSTKFRMMLNGGAVYKFKNINAPREIIFQTKYVTSELNTSTGVSLNSTIDFKAGGVGASLGWQTFGSGVSDTLTGMEMVGTNFRFRVKYKGGYYQFAQNVGNDTSLITSTVSATMTVEGSTGASLSGGIAKFNNKGVGYELFGTGTTPDTMELLPAKYLFKLRFNGIVYYKVQNLDTNSVVLITISTPSKTSNSSLTEGTGAGVSLGVYPNPFDEFTNFTFELEETTEVRLIIYDFSGKMIRRLAKREFESGTNLIPWDGTDNFGNPVANGVYFYRLEAGEFVKTDRIIVTR